MEFIYKDITEKIIGAFIEVHKFLANVLQARLPPADELLQVPHKHIGQRNGKKESKPPWNLYKIKQTCIAFVSCLAISSCINSDDTTQAPSYNPYVIKSGSFVESEGNVVAMDSMEIYSYTRTSGKYIKAGTPDFFSNSRQSIKSGITTTSKESKSIKIDPDSIEAPTFISSSGDRVLSSWPLRKPAQVARVDGTPLDFSFLNVNQGLKSNYISDLIEDRRGNIWIGTFSGGGVSVWDGSGFLHYSSNEGLSVNGVLALLEDQDGNIWIGTNDGLNMWDGNGFTQFTEKEGLSSNGIRDLMEDRNGNIWVGTRNGVSMWDGNGFTQFTEKQGLSSNVILGLLEDRNGDILIGTINGLNVWDGKEISLFPPTALGSPIIRCMLQDEQGAIWIGTRDGVTVWKDSAFVRFNSPVSVSSSNIYDMKMDEQGNIWLAADNGIHVWNGSSFRTINEEFGLSDNRTTCLLIGSDKNIWVGTLAHGLNILDPSSFFDVGSDILENAQIVKLLEDREGNIWGGSTDGLYCWAETGIFRYTQETGLSSSSITTLMEDIKGSIWIGTRNGLNKWDGSGFTQFTREDGLGHNWILSLLQDSDGTIWVGTERGLFFWDGKGFTAHGTINELDNQPIQSLLEDKEGNIWISTFNTISFWDGMTFTTFTDSTGLNNRYLYPNSLIEDQKGNIWIGTYDGGINLWDGKQFHYLIEKEGLSNKVIRTLSQDNTGDIWVGTNIGINRLTPQDENLNWNLHVIDQNDGLQGITIDEILVDRNRWMWVASNKSLSKFDLKIGLPDSSQPEIFIETIQPLYKYVDWRNIPDLSEQNLEDHPALVSLDKIHFDSILRFKNLPHKPIFPHDINQLTLAWRGVHGDATNELQYSYLLRGSKEKLWSPLLKENSVTYTDLRHGQYTFSVVGVGANSKWSDVQNYSFTVLPPWWLSWTAYTIYSLLFLGVIYQGFRFQNRRILAKERAKAKDIELAQAKKIEKAYSDLKSTQTQLIHSEKMASLGELTAGIAHEIQNPLNFVNNFSDVSSEMIDEAVEELSNNDIDEVKDILTGLKGNLEKISHHGNRASSIVKGMLDHSRADTGLKVLTDINALCDEYLRLSYHGLRAKDKSFNGAYEMNFDDSLPKIKVIPQELGRVLLNILNNAFYACATRSVGTSADRSVSTSSSKSKANTQPTDASVSTGLAPSRQVRESKGDPALQNYKPLVTLSTKQLNNSAIITITDNGIGMSNDTLEKVFQPFFTTKPTGSGTGLGMSISYDIITKGHGGEMNVESKEGEGTTFRIEIPTNKNYKHV